MSIGADALSETSSSTSATASSARNPGAVILCPGQGAQQVGMGRTWFEKSQAAKAVFEEADSILNEIGGGTSGKSSLAEICFTGPAETLNRTDVSQPAIYTCSVASWRGLREMWGEIPISATAGLSLGEYTALHIAGVFDFATGLRLVAQRGRLMQEAAEASRGSMVALIGADEEQAQAVCQRAVGTESAPLRVAAKRVEADVVLVCANFNAPGQIVLSGSAQACEAAVEVAGEMGMRATPLTVAGAFHSPLMQPAADRMAEALDEVTFSPPQVPVYSNVTAEPHREGDLELLKRRLIEQIVSPVKWAQTCAALVSQYAGPAEEGASAGGYHELAPGSVLRGLMRRIDRQTKVTSHDEPPEK